MPVVDDVYTLEGEFQGEWIVVDSIRMDESPIRATMQAVLLMGEGDELLSVMVRKPDGTIEVRPWRETGGR